MTTIRQVKYSPRQTQFSTAGYTNIIDFNIESGSYDLSNSWVNINCQVHATSTDATPGGDTTCIHDSTILVNDDADGFSELVDNTHDAIVKNVELSSGNKGVIETRINHNAYKANMNALIRDDEDNQNEEHGSTVVYKSKGLIQNGTINLLNGNGSEHSTVRACNIRLPLKNLLGAGSITNFNTDQMGNLKLHLEVELEKLSAATSTPDIDKTYNSGLDSGNNNKYSEMEDMGTGSVTEITYKIEYNDINDHPFWVDQKLRALYLLDNTTGIKTFDSLVEGASDKTPGHTFGYCYNNNR